MILQQQTHCVKYNVGIYVRLSKDDERMGESLSIENQRLILTKYAHEMGWHVQEIYIDDGYSGTTFDRPSVIKMIDDAKEGKINLILVKDLSRFGRNYIQVGQYTDYVFPMLNVRFIALNDGVDTLHSDNDIMPFKNLFNEFHSRDTSRKIKAVKKACASDGKYIGSMVAFGYKKSPEDKYKLIVDEEAVSIVRKIFDLRSCGYGYRKIAGILNAEGVMPPNDYYFTARNRISTYYTNHLWNDATIKFMLHNETYIGNIVQCKRAKLSYKSNKVIENPKSEWIRTENTHEAIISPEVWQVCQEINAKHYKPRSRKNGELSLFSGILKCMDCGFRMSHYKANTSPMYKCGNYSRSGKHACSAHIVAERILAELILGEIRKHTSRIIADENGLKQELINIQNKDGLEKEKADREQQKRLHKRILELNRLIQSVYEDKVLGTLSADMCQNLLGKYEMEFSEKTAQLQEIETQLAQNVKSERNVDEFITAIKKYVSVEQLDREMLLELVDYIEVGEKQVNDGQVNRDIVVHYKFVGKI